MLLATAQIWGAPPATYLDLAPSGRLTTWADSRQRTRAFKQWPSLSVLPAGSRCVGIVWDEERDVCKIRAKFDGPSPTPETAMDVQYWRSTWPPEPPKMPTIEDAADDPWQGIWKKARVHRVDRDGVTSFTFEPLTEQELHGADILPGVTYRRTLKVRLLLPEKPPRLTALEIFSETTLEPLSIRIELGAGEKEPSLLGGSLEIFNGIIKSVSPWQFESGESFASPGTWKNVVCDKPKGLTVDLLSAKPSPPGSNDITVVTVRAEAKRGDKTLPRTFSFSTLDLQHGPIYVPDLHAYVTRTDDPQPFSIQQVRTGQTIRERILLEPEQTYERAMREIPRSIPGNARTAARSTFRSRPMQAGRSLRSNTTATSSSTRRRPRPWVRNSGG